MLLNIAHHVARSPTMSRENAPRNGGKDGDGVKTPEKGRSPVTEAEAAESLHDYLAWLERKRDSILKQGIGPEGAWIESGKVGGREWRQAYWRASTPIFPSSRSRGDGSLVKRLYIGREGGPEHKAAIAQHNRRKEFDSLTKKILKIEEAIANADTI